MVTELTGKVSMDAPIATTRDAAASATVAGRRRSLPAELQTSRRVVPLRPAPQADASMTPSAAELDATLAEHGAGSNQAELAPARGTGLALVLGVVLWAAIALGLWLIFWR